jgi:hypothetical protein
MKQQSAVLAWYHGGDPAIPLEQQTQLWYDFLHVPT